MFQREEDISKLIDQTHLQPELSLEELKSLVKRCIKYNFHSLFIHPFHVTRAKEIAQESSLKIGTVIGFPFGAQYSEVKILEAKIAQEKGADEIDMVINLSALKSKLYSLVEEEVECVIKASPRCGHKVIIETGLLTAEEMSLVCELMNEVAPDFVKTSTGITSRGVTVKDVVFLRGRLRPEIGIKASGGIRHWQFIEELCQAGASRMGTSAGFEIIEEWRKTRT